MSAARWQGRAVLLLFPLVAALLLWPVLFGGEVLLPGARLLYFSPWKEALQPPRDAIVPWNALLWDGMAQFYPWRDFAARWIRAGQIPLWEPYQFCGTPFLANSQSAPLYPLHLLYYLPLGASTAVRMGWVAAIHLAIAGTGTFLWTRALGARPGAAALSGVAYLGSGFAITWLELPSFLSVACWLPYLLLAFTRAFQGTGRGWPWLAGGALGLMILGGHLQIAFYGILAATLLFFYELAAWGISRARRRRGSYPLEAAAVGQRVVIAAAAGVLGLSLAAAQLLPTLDLSRSSHRAGAANEEGYGAYVGYAMHPAGLVTIFAPDYFGNPSHGTFHAWPRSEGRTLGNYTEYAGYIGITALAFSLLGVILGWRVHRQAPFLGALALVSLWMATGGWPNRLLYFGVPGFGQSGAPGRILVLFCLVGAVLAGVGAEIMARALESEDRARLRSVGAVGLLILLATAALFVVTQSYAVPVDARWHARWIRDSRVIEGEAFLRELISVRAAGVRHAWLLLLVGAGIPVLLVHAQAITQGRTDLPRRLAPLPVALAVGADLASFAYPFNPTCPPSLIYPATALTSWLRSNSSGERFVAINDTWVPGGPLPSLMPPNAALAYGVADAQGYDSLFLGRYKTLVRNSLSPPDEPSPVENGNIVFLKRPDAGAAAMLSTRYVLTHGKNVPPGFQRIATLDSVTVLRAQVSAPIARFVEELRAADDGRALKEMRELAVHNPARFARTAWVPAGHRSATLEPAGADPPAWSVEGPGRRRIAVRSATGGTLLLAENYHPGWKARWEPANGLPLERTVARANVAFQVVRVPPGEGDLWLRYEPFVFRAGLFLTLAGIAILAALAGWSPVARRRRNGPPGVPTMRGQTTPGQPHARVKTS